VVGEVVSLREKLRWFDNRPLFGKRILVTRARRQASALSQLLYEHGALPIELPAIDIQPMTDTTELSQALSNLKYYDWIVFTSVNGVGAFFQQLYRLKLDSRALSGLKVAAIGPATAKTLAAKGITPDYLPETYTSESLINGLKSWDIAGERFLLPRADIVDKELTEGITRLGAEVHEVATYRVVPAAEAISRARQTLLSGEIDVITFTSSSTVSNLVSVFKEAVVNRATVACIGPKTADTAVKAGLRVDIVAQEHTIPGLVTAIEEYFRKET